MKALVMVLLFAYVTVAVAGPRYLPLVGFELGNDCEPVALIVEQVCQAETRLGLDLRT